MTEPAETDCLAPVPDFIMMEARLLDEQRWDTWLSLFEPDGHYWVPTSPAQTDPNRQPSLAYEDQLLLNIRIERLRHPQAHSQKPPSQCQHVLQTPDIRQNADGSVTSRTPFTYVESRGTKQIWLAGVLTHTLVRREGRLLIRLKRVDLLNAQAALPMIQLFL